jgi:plastocyanin
MKTRQILSCSLLTVFLGTGSALLLASSDETGSDYKVALVSGSGTANYRESRSDNPAEAAHVISQLDKTFAPERIQVRVGDAVAIVNDDNTVHNAYCRSGDFKYNSGPQAPGSQSTLTFETAGTYEVRCAIHPKMKLTVEVVE